jgi:hypothetical protein
MERSLRGIILVAMAVVAILLCLDVAYLVSGSLEQMPTPEQEDKVRIVTSVIAIMLLAVEAALWFIYRNPTRNAGGSSDPADRGR